MLPLLIRFCPSSLNAAAAAASAQGPVVIMDGSAQRGLVADKLGHLYKVDESYF